MVDLPPDLDPPLHRVIGRTATSWTRQHPNCSPPTASSAVISYPQHGRSYATPTGESSTFAARRRPRTARRSRPERKKRDHSIANPQDRGRRNHSDTNRVGWPARMQARRVQGLIGDRSGEVCRRAAECPAGPAPRRRGAPLPRPGRSVQRISRPDRPAARDRAAPPSRRRSGHRVLGHEARLRLWSEHLGRDGARQRRPCRRRRRHPDAAPSGREPAVEEFSRLGHGRARYVDIVAYDRVVQAVDFASDDTRVCRHDDDDVGRAGGRRRDSCRNHRGRCPRRHLCRRPRGGTFLLARPPRSLRGVVANSTRQPCLGAGVREPCRDAIAARD